jgi:hypothetical protein
LGQLVTAPFYWEKTEHFAHLAKRAAPQVKKRMASREIRWRTAK